MRLHVVFTTGGDTMTGAGRDARSSAEHLGGRSPPPTPTARRFLRDPSQCFSLLRWHGDYMDTGSATPRQLLMVAHSEHWRQRAEQSRALAESMSNGHAKDTTLWIADIYQEMAKNAETIERAADPLGKTSPTTTPALSSGCPTIRGFY